MAKDTDARAVELHDRALDRLKRLEVGGCVVASTRCVGLDEDEFVVHEATPGGEFHYCKVHALAAEALVTFTGCRGAMVGDLLKLLERGR